MKTQKSPRSLAAIKGHNNQTKVHNFCRKTSIPHLNKPWLKNQCIQQTFVFMSAWRDKR